MNPQARPLTGDDRSAAPAASARVTPGAVHRALSAGDPPSPCVSVCSIDAASGLCAGCLRTLGEIAAWSTLDAAARRSVWLAIARRAGIPAESVPGAPAGPFPSRPCRP